MILGTAGVLHLNAAPTIARTLACRSFAKV
jgi:hypothetical protein